MGLSMQQDLQVRSLRAKHPNLSHRKRRLIPTENFQEGGFNYRATSGIGEGTAYLLHGKEPGCSSMDDVKLGRQVEAKIKNFGVKLHTIRREARRRGQGICRSLCCNTTDWMWRLIMQDSQPEVCQTARTAHSGLSRYFEYQRYGRIFFSLKNMRFRKCSSKVMVVLSTLQFQGTKDLRKWSL